MNSSRRCCPLRYEPRLLRCSAGRSAALVSADMSSLRRARMRASSRDPSARLLPPRKFSTLMLANSDNSRRVRPPVPTTLQRERLRPLQRRRTMTSGRVDSPTRAVRPWRIAIIAGLASFVDGAALSANGIALVIYQHTIGLTANQVGFHRRRHIRARSRRPRRRACWRCVRASQGLHPDDGDDRAGQLGAHVRHRLLAPFRRPCGPRRRSGCGPAGLACNDR